MRTLLYLSFLLYFFNNSLNAQSELSISRLEFEIKDNLLNTYIFVDNTANQKSEEGFIYAYLDEKEVGKISLKQLSPYESEIIKFIYPSGDLNPEIEHHLKFLIGKNNLQNNCQSNNCISFLTPSSQVTLRKVIYPVVFIHGWTDNDKVWDNITRLTEQRYGWRDGGRLDYCLNPDHNQFTSDQYILHFTDTTQLRGAEYYTINFDADRNGTPYTNTDLNPLNNNQSNQSAVVKQGWALKDAIEKILQVSGAEKVILVGHSMGGIASREYIQNEDNWQKDGHHHVAKVLTLASPHGGTDISILNIGLFAGYDEKSEAIRDLRFRNFFYGGQYLEGGRESFFSLFYNNDVDVNGKIGDNIIGLNQKFTPQDIAYATIVGTGNNFPNFNGDGGVVAARADLNNYLKPTPPSIPQRADRFDVAAFHSDIPKVNLIETIRGLDEPGILPLYYNLDLNGLTMGISTIQANNHTVLNKNIDNDYYKINLDEDGYFSIEITNIPVSEMAVSVLDENENVLIEKQSLGEGSLLIDELLEKGSYFVKVQTIANEDSWKYPFWIRTNFTTQRNTEIDFTADQTVICDSTQISFDTDSETTFGNLLWEFEGAEPSESRIRNPKILYKNEGNYVIKLNIIHGEDTLSHVKEDYISVVNSPKADISFTQNEPNTYLFSNKNENANDTYLWDFGDGNNSEKLNPSHLFEEGVFDVVLESSNRCGADSDSIEINNISVANEFISDLDASLFPNPTNEKIFIQSERITGKIDDISIFTVEGKIVESKKMVSPSSTGLFEIDVQNLPIGYYLLSIQDKNGFETLPFVKF